MTESIPVDGPLLSVVVTIVDGGDVLRRFLRALTSQSNSPAMQILVPFDSSIDETAALIAEFPGVTPVQMGSVPTVRPIGSAAGQHELYDRRRGAGLGAARGTIVAILEDRAPARSDWARTVVKLHQQHSYAVIGGAIECAPTDLLNWAFYVCDFSRYGLPFESEPRQWISDLNVSYKRKAIDDTRSVWEVRFNEPLVHWALMQRGETLYLSSELVVDYRTPYKSLFAVLPERFHWGRLFGQVRAMKLSPLSRLGHIVLGPVIPFVLLLRHGVTQYKKGNIGRFIQAAPIIGILLTAWTSGEVWGYITREP
ncbi:MAG: hypothetical protein WKF37_19985 [Bryobacteraceae bacterium]